VTAPGTDDGEGTHLATMTVRALRDLLGASTSPAPCNEDHDEHHVHPPPTETEAT
jgi:hypothetical protein